MAQTEIASSMSTAARTCNSISRKRCIARVNQGLAVVMSISTPRRPTARQSAHSLNFCLVFALGNHFRKVHLWFY